MFHSARLKLTSWYLLIIMLISISFSMAIFRVLSAELERVQRFQRFRVEYRLPERLHIQMPPALREELSRPNLAEPDIFAETKNRIKIILTAINLVILFISAGLGYLLAGRTLKPIQEMVSEQSRFITDASHELRTPLTSLRSEIEVSLRDDKLTFPEARKLLVSNLEEVNNLQVLTDGLIKLTQYQKGENGFSLSIVTLDTIVNEAVRKVANIAKQKQISVLNKAGKFTIEGNKQALTEMLVIFLDNAIKYSHAKAKVCLASEKIDGHIIFSIADNGIGIHAEDIPYLFDRFYRADKSRTKTETSGYGLGLSIAKQIIDRHKGSVKVKSTVGKGTTFSIKLPIKHPRGLI